MCAKRSKRLKTGFNLEIPEVKKTSSALLHTASLMVNNLLKTQSAAAAFNNLVQYEDHSDQRAISNNFQKVCIRFKDIGRSKIAATNRDPANLTNTTIFIHSDIEIRHTKSSDAQEKKYLEVYTSVCIIHELGHLIERWKGYRLSQDDRKLGISEAGQEFETEIFNGCIRMVIKKTTDHTKKFSADTPVVFLILQTCAQKLELQSNQFDGWHQVGFSSFFPLKRTGVYKSHKGFILSAFKCEEPFDSSAVYRKRKDEVIVERGLCTFED
jgi:hypothetical protein